MSTKEYIFVDGSFNYELSGQGVVSAGPSDTGERFEIVATTNDISVRDHGNGMDIKIVGRRSIALDYRQIADIIRCVRMMDAHNKQEGHLPLDISSMFLRMEE